MTASRLRYAGAILSAGLLLSLSARDRYVGEFIKDPGFRMLYFAQSQTLDAGEGAIPVPTPYGLRDLQPGPGWVWRPTPEELQRVLDYFQNPPSPRTPLGPLDQWTLEMTPERRRKVWMEHDLTLREHGFGFSEVEQEPAEAPVDEGSSI